MPASPRTRCFCPSCARPAIPARSVRSAVMARPPGAWPAPSGARRLVHRLVSKAIGVRVGLAPDVLERDASDLVREEPRPGVERLETGVLHLEVTEHLLDEEQGVGPHVNAPGTVRAGPLERRQEALILGD